MIAAGAGICFFCWRRKRRRREKREKEMIEQGHVQRYTPSPGLGDGVDSMSTPERRTEDKGK
jgi:hypothetical protein